MRHGPISSSDDKRDARSWAPLGTNMKIDRCEGIFDRDAHGSLRRLDGELKNEDTWIALDDSPARIESEAA